MTCTEKTRVILDVRQHKQISFTFAFDALFHL